MFDDDVATDVRAASEDAIGGGASPAEATSSLIDELVSAFIDDVDDGPVYWIARRDVNIENPSGRRHAAPGVGERGTVGRRRVSMVGGTGRSQSVAGSLMLCLHLMARRDW
jgi:hypothetical protein